MKTKMIGLTLLLSLAAGAMCFANPNLGTWKLNESKSKFGAGAAKPETVVWATAGDQVKVTVDGTTADGKKMHQEWTGKVDGKDYPLRGDPKFDTRAFKMSGENTTEITSKKDGKVVGTATIVVAADGKSRTVTINMTNAKGEKVTTTAVYDKS